MATVPSITNTDRVLDATATPGQTEFTIAWPVFADSEAAAVNDLVVLIDGDLVDADELNFVGAAIVGVSGVWNGGIVVLESPCSGGERVIIWSDRAPRRVGSFLEGKALPFTELDKLLDDLVSQVRDMQLRSKRGVTISVADYLDGVDPDDAASDLLQAASDAQNYAEQAGAASLGQVDTVNALRALDLSNLPIGSAVRIKAFSALGDGGEGDFTLRSGSAPGDDGGKNIVSATAPYWFSRRGPAKEFRAAQFGLAAVNAAAVNSAAFANLAAAVNSAGGGRIIFDSAIDIADGVVFKTDNLLFEADSHKCWLRGDLLPVMPPFMGRVCSGYAPGWGVLQTPSV